MILFNSETVIVRAINNIIEFIAMDNVELSHWKAGFKIGLDYLQGNNCRGWLNDLTKLKSTGAKHLQFLQEYVNSAAFKLYPPVKVAFIEPKDVFGYCSMLGYIGSTNLRIDKNIILKVFSGKDEALHWIEEPQEIKKTKLFPFLFFKPTLI